MSKRHILCCFTMLMTALAWAPASALAGPGYRANVDYIDSRQFPRLGVYVSVTDSQGFLVKNLVRTDFALSEDNRLITDFTVKPVENTEQPLAVVLVIDASGSMNTRPLPTPLQSSISAARAFLGTLQPADQVALVAFADSPVVVSNFVQDKSTLVTPLDNLQSGNKAAMFDAISNAVGLLKNRSERRVIILITDGRDTRSHATIDQAIAEANQASVQIYPIGFGAVNTTQLYKLANGTGGSALIQPGPSALQAAFANILQILREQYLVEYSSVLAADNQQHTLAVAVTVQKTAVNASANFIAHPGEVKVTLPYAESQTVAGDVIIKPDVISPAPVDRLEISLDGSPLVTRSSAPFEYIWRSTTVDPGVHEVAVKVTDKSGNTGALSVHLNVQPPVVIKIAEPANGANVQGSTRITPNVATLPEDQIRSVQIAIDGQIFYTLTSKPYAADWDAARFTAGKHTIRATAFDINGFSAQDEVTIYVQPGGGPGWLIILALVALAAIIIPVALRSRKRRGQTGVAPRSSMKGEPGTARLQELEGHNTGQKWSLGTTAIRLGRKRDENDIHLKGLGASRSHAVIHAEQGQYIIEAVRPDNPVLVNGEAISGQHVLQPGDMIRLGETVLRFERS